MKKLSHLIVFGFSFIFLLAACDKIEENEYVVFAGAAGTWYDDSENIDATQRAFIEKYTGCRCKNCPTADSVIHETQQHYGSRLVAVAIHPKGSNYTIPYSGEPDLGSDDGKTWNDAHGFNSYPQALINRNGEAFVPITNFDSRVEMALGVTPQMGIAVSCERNSGNDSITITAHLSFLTQVSADLNLTLLISEDGIVTTQKMPDGSDQVNYMQNHVLRDVITDVWGTPVDKGSANGETGSRRMAQFTYLPDAGWNLNQCHIVAFVSNRDTKEILNVAECGIE